MKLDLKVSALALSFACLFASPASASLVYDASIVLSAQGFGTAPRDLSMQSQGNNTSESGCVGVAAGGGITFGSGSCIGSGSVFGSNGVANTGGDEPNPLGDNQKYGIPTLAELGWTSAADIGLMFNATENGGDSVTITDVTLKFYDPTTGALIKAIDGNHTFASSNPGNGVAGFAFVVDAAQQIELNNTVFNQVGFGNFRIALESTVTDVSGGAESWLAFNRRSPTAPLPEPATWGMMLLGFGGIGMAMRKRNRSRQTRRVRFA